MVKTVRAQDGHQRRFAPLRPRGHIMTNVTPLGYDNHRNVQQPGIGLDLVPESFPSQSPYPTVGPHTNASLDSNQAIASTPSPDSGTPTSSTWSRRTSLLARERRMTPGLDTPTSSVASSKQQGKWVQIGQTRRRGGSIGRQMSKSLNLGEICHSWQLT
jgi:hypothetical protein